ncbi:2-isopropylmalate synthase [Agromyces sp. NPDC056379]|uniref:2-isopropylmalate synthase n=1 Tax=unclassified Agromyces TaxID=2639701 RepID=UPI0035DC2A8F
MPAVAPSTAADHPHWNRQRPSEMPSHRYREVHERVEIAAARAGAPPRDWPANRLTAAPLWVPVDLRDGNQALAEPMDPARKLRFFRLLVELGYTEIEIGYPSASQTDFDFVRLLAEREPVPEHVTLVVFTPARPELVDRTMASIRGIRNPVVVHLYVATAPIWRQHVLGRDREQIARLVADESARVRRGAGDDPRVRFEFSPEVFNQTEPDFVLELADTVTGIWDASPERPVILNLPATVEIATPNVYADQIEHMHRNLPRRDGVILSVHPHNDRGTGVACAELAVLAGAQRVEGCLFGNGERTGNVDLVTLALNLHAQGVDPEIDFSDLARVREVVESCNRIPVHPRHPYAGELVHTAFSGTHQDAIRKGFAEHAVRAAALGAEESEIAWHVPYLPIDPADLGLGYEAVIRVNSQSGKGGIAHLIEERTGLRMSRETEVSFARVVQGVTDASGRELDRDELWELFRESFPQLAAAHAVMVGGVDAHD